MAITVNDKDLGMVTAYAYALAGGYTGTEAEFEALLGKIAEDLAEIENLSVQVQTLPAGSDATASYAEGVLTLGIPRGDKGETGDQGEIGPTPQLSVGAVTTGEPGTDAEVEITGTHEAPVLNFTIPRGDTGNITQAVRYDAAQTLTDAQKEQARANIDAADAGEVADLKSALDETVISESTLDMSTLNRSPMWIKVSGVVTLSTAYSAARLTISDDTKYITLTAPTNSFLNIIVLSSAISNAGDYSASKLFGKQIAAGAVYRYNIMYHDVYYYVSTHQNASEWSSDPATIVYGTNIAASKAELATVKTEVEAEIDEVKDAVQTTTVCIDATDTRTYETAINPASFAHPYSFKAGKTYHAVLKVNHAVFTSGTNNTIRIQQSAAIGASALSLLGTVFAIDSSQITDGAIFEKDFVAVEGCVNLLARYKFEAGEQSIDLDVTLTEYITADIEDIKKDVQKKYDECIIKSRMLMGAHRGAEAYAPPNCVAAYEIAGKMGFPWAWLAQIRYSAENTLYVMHDEDVSITTNGTGNMSELYDEYINGLLCNKISSYDYTQFTDDDLRVPTLEKAIQICLRYGMKMCFRIEPFPNSMETERQTAIWTNFQTLIKAYGITPEWACYSGYNSNEMKLCRTLLGDDVELCPYIGTVTAQEVIDWFTASNIGGNRSVLLPATSLTLEGIKLLHTNGIKVYAFTNGTTPTQEQMEQLATWGVDILQNPKYARIPIV